MSKTTHSASSAQRSLARRKADCPVEGLSGNPSSLSHNASGSRGRLAASTRNRFRRTPTPIFEYAQAREEPTTVKA